VLAGVESRLRLIKLHAIFRQHRKLAGSIVVNYASDLEPTLPHGMNKTFDISYFEVARRTH
jgi:hypothetical protein